MNKLYRILTLPALALLSAALLFACSNVQTLDGAERDAVLAYAEPKTENLLNGFNAGDYTVFSRDFDAAMRRAQNEAAFTQTRTLILSKIGAYVSRRVASVFKQDNYLVVLYNCKFEQADDVSVRVVFQPGGAHEITGLWFNSPKLQ